MIETELKRIADALEVIAKWSQVQMDWHVKTEERINNEKSEQKETKKSFGKSKVEEIEQAEEEMTDDCPFDVEEDEEVKVVSVKAKKKPLPFDNDDEDDEEEPEPPKKTKKSKAKIIEDDDEEDEPPVKKSAKKAPAKKPKPAFDDDFDDDDFDI